jgi:hypothetical protein
MIGFTQYINSAIIVLKPYKYLLNYVIEGKWTQEKLQETLIFLLRHRN